VFIQRHVKEWWFEPTIQKKRIRIPKSFDRLDPCDPSHSLNLPPVSRIGAFKHSRHWVRYNRLQPIDSGYITPLYDLNCIAKRYGLSANGQRYFRKYILPEPFDIVRRRSVQAHHWSRFTLMVLDTVLLDLQKRGYTQFLKSFEDHIELVQVGVSFLEDYYAHKAEAIAVDSSDRHGVKWLE
jgi:hypothetical protein